MDHQTHPISTKMETCLDFLDEQLEQSKHHTISIAETIIEDIKTLTEDYYDAQRNHDLAAHIEKVRQAQFKWINALQTAIFEQSDQVLSHEVMKSLQKFAQQLNRLQNPTLDLELPMALEERLPETTSEPTEAALPSTAAIQHKQAKSRTESAITKH